MNGKFLPRWLGWALAALLLLPVLALAQSPYEGIYLGTYQGTNDDGEFALIVSDQGHGTLAAYDAVDDVGYIEKNIRVRSDGSFQFVTLRGAHITGQATAFDVSGLYTANGTEGSFSGWRAADEGPFQDSAGYYSGPVSITGTGPDTDIVVNSRLVAIIAADGSAFFLLDRAFPTGAEIWPDGFDFDLGNGFGPGFGFDFGSQFPFGPGSGPSFPFGPGFNSPFPFGQGSNSPFPFGQGFNSPFPFGQGFNSSFPFGQGFNSSFNIGSGFGFNSSFQFGSGSCGTFPFGSGFGWPFNFSIDYSLRLSFLGFIDLDFTINLPTCSTSVPWTHFNTPVDDSGGFVQIGNDGLIQDSLLDGLELQGYLDPETASAEGNLYFQGDAATWSGDWLIERRDSGSLQTLKRYIRLTDVDGDGSADILWHNAESGENAVWLMDGAEIMAELPLEVQGDPAGDPQWVLTAVTQLNDDHTPVLIWRHAITGEIFVLPGDDAAPVYFELDPAWQIVGSGDFDADGQPELLVRHSGTGANAVITNLLDQAGIVPLQAMEDQAWTTAAVADFDGDTHADVLWVNRYTSDLLIWLMDGFVLADELHVAAEVSGLHELAGLGDFDGDGATDLLWRDHATDIVIVTLRPVSDDAEDIQLGENLDRAWLVAAVGDLDDDGTDDLILRHGLTGENAAWRIVDTRVEETSPLMWVPDLNWKIQP